MVRVSVCMATYNGENFIEEQVNSILKQLSKDDELIISDDGSSDGTLTIVENFKDKRIQVFHNLNSAGYTPNFYHAFSKSNGKYIFVSDQDDVWLPNKVETILNYLDSNNYQMVISDCTIVDEELNTIHESYFKIRSTQKGFVNTIKKSGYLGCCMGFKREVYERCSPYPLKYKYMPYDLWLGLVGYAFFNVATINDKLILYRRHSNNASDGGVKNKINIIFKISYRLYAIYSLLLKFFRISWRKF